MLSVPSKGHQVCRYEPVLKLHRTPHCGEVSNKPQQRKSPGNPALSASGTALAINTLGLGVVANNAPTPSRRGGARNRRDRRSQALTVSQVRNLIAATHHAHVIGLPFNRMITIHWEAAGVALEGMAKATGRFTDLLAKALRRHGAATAWLWVHENGDGKGGHCHMLAHVPASLVPVVSRLQKGWLGTITGRPYRKGVILSRPIGGRLGLETGNPALHAHNLEVVLSYVLKGADAAAAEKFNLPRREPCGCIIGKRCGTSQNIGPKARERDGETWRTH